MIGCELTNLMGHCVIGAGNIHVSGKKKHFGVNLAFGWSFDANTESLKQKTTVVIPNHTKQMLLHYFWHPLLQLKELKGFIGFSRYMDETDKKKI